MLSIQTVLTCAIVFMGAVPLLAASLSGTIQDQQDGVIVSAKVTLLDPKKGLSREMTTDANGAFVFSQVAPSTYELTVEQTGFSKARFVDIAINANDRRSLRVSLNVAKRDETIVVTGETSLVRESPSVATSVDRAFIENQPLNGRSFQTLINLSPGVVLVPSSLPAPPPRHHPSLVASD